MVDSSSLPFIILPSLIPPFFQFIHPVVHLSIGLLVSFVPYIICIFILIYYVHMYLFLAEEFSTDVTLKYLLYIYIMYIISICR